jgi:hypothetical protein
MREKRTHVARPYAFPLSVCAPLIPLISFLTKRLWSPPVSGGQSVRLVLAIR